MDQTLLADLLPAPAYASEGTEENFAQKAAKDTKTDQELGFCHDSALPKQAKEWGPRNTRKDAKGEERCGLGGRPMSHRATRHWTR